jgi:hypothetical protein
MKVSFALSALLAVTCLCYARPVRHWTYEQLAGEADLVVIATPTETRDKDKTVIPNLQRAGAGGQGVPVAAIGIETRFDVLAVLKGDKELKDFRLYHLKEAGAEKPPAPNGPLLVSFDPKARRRYLLFLKRQGDGRFVPVPGQTDAAVGVKDLGTYP